MGEKDQHWGTTLDDFLHEEGIFEMAKAEALKRWERYLVSCETVRHEDVGDWIELWGDDLEGG